VHVQIILMQVFSSGTAGESEPAVSVASSMLAQISQHHWQVTPHMHLVQADKFMRASTRQTALESQDLSCTYLAPHELYSI